MKIVIAGAGEVGTHLAKMLSKDEHDIILFDEAQDKLDNISAALDVRGPFLEERYQSMI